MTLVCPGQSTWRSWWVCQQRSLAFNRHPPPCALHRPTLVASLRPLFKCLAVQQDISNRRRDTLEFDLDDLAGFTMEEGLLERMETNTYQYLHLIGDAADAVMPAPSEADLPEDVFDIMMDHRLRNQEVMSAQAEVDGVQRRDPANAVPASLTRRYDVLVCPRSKARTVALRAISAKDVGESSTHIH